MDAAKRSAAVFLTALARREWARFRARRRLAALAAAALSVILLGVVFAAVHPSGTCSEGTVAVACPVDPVGPDGTSVSDKFFFAHRPLGENGSITVRLTSMTGIITYPPPDHDEIVPGLVPWAKAGLVIKDGTAPGSSYAAIMATGDHGVRMQHDYVHDIAGRPGGVSAKSPRWLRLTRSGDNVTGAESADGEHWTTVGAVRVPGLPATASVGMFAASPGDLTLTRTALGARLPEARFTQATAVFDHVSLDGAPDADWSAEAVGELGATDWEKFHRAPGLVRSAGAYTVTGSGDIGPVPEGGRTTHATLVGLVIGLVIVIVVAVRFASPGRRPRRSGGAANGGGDIGAAAAGSGAAGARALLARSVVMGAAAFAVGLVAAGVVVPVGTAILRAGDVGVLAVPTLTVLRVVVGVAALFALVGVFALALGTLLRRARPAAAVAIAVLVVPYVLAALPLLPDGVAQWLLRLTPAAAFAVQQTAVEYPQVTAHYVPSGGYFPLSDGAGLAVLCGYTALVFGLVAVRARRCAGSVTGY